VAVTGAHLRVLVLADARSVHTQRFAAELRRQGCAVLVASLEGSPVDPALGGAEEDPKRTAAPEAAGAPGEPEEGCGASVRLRRRFPIRTVAYAWAAREVERLIERWRPEAISAHYAAGYGYLLSRVRRRPPATLHVWGSDVLVVPHRSRLHLRKVVRGLRAADHIFADSRYLAEEAGRLAGVTNVTVHPWGIERRHLQRRLRVGSIGRPLRIIVPRMHETVYDNEFVLEALREMIIRGEATVTFPAFGSRYERFRRRAEGMGLRVVSLEAGAARDGTGTEADPRGAVCCYEKRNRDGFLALMAAHDVYVSAARSDSSPATLIEAMALGLAPVAADIPGVREWLTPESGFAFRPGDAESLRTILARLATGEAGGAECALDGLRRRNREQVEREAIFEDNIAAQLAVMRALCGKAGH